MPNETISGHADTLYRDLKPEKTKTVLFWGTEKLGILNEIISRRRWILVTRELLFPAVSRESRVDREI